MKEVIVRYADNSYGNAIGEAVGELVRCGECIHKDDICDYCYEHERNIKDNDFCSYGERRSK